MSKPKVYIETTIPSYLTARPSRDAVTRHRRRSTQTWWRSQRSKYDLFTSQVALQEAEAGDPEAAQRRLAALQGLPLLDLTAEVEELVAKIVGPGMIPREYPEDASHIAVATVNGLDYLLTWNLSHIAKRDAPEQLRTSHPFRGVRCANHLHARRVNGG